MTDKRRRLAELLKKDRPGLHDDAARLADAGRYGDKIVAHITPEEAQILRARGGSGTVNPRTGLLEFWDPSDPGDSGPPSDSTGPDFSGAERVATDITPGGTQVGVGFTGGNGPSPGLSFEGGANTPTDVTPGSGGYSQVGGPVTRDWTSPNPTGLPGYMTGQGVGFFKSVPDWFGDKIARARDNPIATALNAAVSLTPLSIPNMVVGAINPDMTIGALATNGARSLASALAGPPSPEVQGVSAGSPAPEDTDKKDYASQGGDGNAYLAAASGAQGSPLGGALDQSPLSASMPTVPKNPNALKTYGALVSSYSPFGREYVTPWAYRG